MIRERKGKWQVRVYAGTENGRRRHLVETVPTYDDAKRRHRELAAEVEQGRNVSAAKMTVAELCQRWLNQAGPDLSPTTLVNYQNMVAKHIGPRIGHVPIAKLTTARIEELYSELRPVLSAQSIRHIHAVLRRALNVAIRWGYLTRNPASTAEAPKVRPVSYVPPTPEEMKAFLRGLEPSLQMFVLLAAVTGMRRGEVCGLRWTDFDDDFPTLSVVTVRRALINVNGQVLEKGTKTDRVRTVALDAGTTGRLRTHRTAEQAKADQFGVQFRLGSPMFTNDPGVPWAPDIASHRFRRAAKRAELGARLHDLRHWAGTYGTITGGAARQVGQRLGHADGELVNKRYGHPVQAADQAIADALGALLED